MIRIVRVEVTAEVTDQLPLSFEHATTVIPECVTVTYRRNAAGEWEDDARVKLAVDGTYLLPETFKANSSGHPPWLQQFIADARPDRGVLPCLTPESLPPSSPDST